MPSLETRSARLKLTPRVKPYWHQIQRGISLGYRAGPGSWSVRCADGKRGNWIKILGHADDRQDANGTTVLSFVQAMDRARQLATGGEAADPHAGTRPVTLAEALTDYRADLVSRRQAPENADYVRCHIPQSMRARPVTMLTVRELRQWRDGLLGKMAPASVNRRSNALKAALNHAAKLDTADRQHLGLALWADGRADRRRPGDRQQHPLGRPAGCSHRGGLPAQ